AGDRTERFGVPNDLALFAGGRLPEPNGLVAAATDQGLAVWQKSDPNYAIRVRFLDEPQGGIAFVRGAGRRPDIEDEQCQGEEPQRQQLSGVSCTHERGLQEKGKGFLGSTGLRYKG